MHHIWNQNASKTVLYSHPELKSNTTCTCFLDANGGNANVAEFYAALLKNCLQNDS